MNTFNQKKDIKNSGLRTGSQTTISELPTLSPVALTDNVIVENDTGTYKTTIADVLAGSGGGTSDVTKEYVDTQDALLKVIVDANTDNINLILQAPLTEDANVLGTEEILTRDADGNITTINQSVLAGSGGGGTDYATKSYVDSHDGILQSRIDAINKAELTPDADVLGTEEILARKPDGTMTTINQSVLAGSGGGTSDVTKEYVDTQDALLKVIVDANTTSITTNTTDIATNTTDIATNTTDIATNTTKTSELDTRVANLEAGTGGDGLPPMKEFDLDIQSATFLMEGDAITPYSNFTIDLATAVPSDVTHLNLLNGRSAGVFTFQNLLATNIRVIKHEAIRTSADITTTTFSDFIFADAQGLSANINLLSEYIAGVDTDGVAYSRIPIPLYNGKYSYFCDISEFRVSGNRFRYELYFTSVYSNMDKKNKVKVYSTEEVDNIFIKQCPTFTVGFGGGLSPNIYDGSKYIVPFIGQGNFVNLDAVLLLSNYLTVSSTYFTTTNSYSYSFVDAISGYSFYHDSTTDEDFVLSPNKSLEVYSGDSSPSDLPLKYKSSSCYYCKNNSKYPIYYL